MVGYIYITTNLINGRQYIGFHLSPEFDESYKGSGTVLLMAIEKYGWENFECHILPSINNVPTICDTLGQLMYSEWYYIKYYNCVKDRHYYNLKEGGTGGGEPGTVWLTGPDGTHRKINPETQPELFMSLIDNGYIRKGPEQSQETKDKRAKVNTGKKRTQSTKDKISAALTGKPKKPLSRETIESIAFKNRTSNSRKRSVKCIETNELYISLGEASRETGISKSSICCCCKGKYENAGGFHWAYVN